MTGIRALLEAEGLPTNDLSNFDLQFLVVCDESDEITAAGGLQWCGKTALLRSVVVAPDARGTGLGQRLLKALECAARAGEAAHWFC